MQESDTVRNHFSEDASGERYARYRLEFHGLAAEKLRESFPERVPFALGLDLGCGTGNSARALATLCRNTLGVDPSPGMLAQARLRPLANLTYLEGRAEAIPHAAQDVEIVTIGLAFHWMDRRKLFPELRRIMKPAGVLAVYSSGFSGGFSRLPACQTWYQEEFAKQFPSPARHAAPFGDEDARGQGFEPLRKIELVHRKRFTPAELAGYLSTQSNVIDHCKRTGERAEDVIARLRVRIGGLFPEESADLEFHGNMRIFARG